jgi:hypothetical protein
LGQPTPPALPHFIQGSMDTLPNLPFQPRSRLQIQILMDCAHYWTLHNSCVRSAAWMKAALLGSRELFIRHCPPHRPVWHSYRSRHNLGARQSVLQRRFWTGACSFARSSPRPPHRGVCRAQRIAELLHNANSYSARRKQARARESRPYRRRRSEIGDLRTA